MKQRSEEKSGEVTPHFHREPVTVMQIITMCIFHLSIMPQQKEKVESNDADSLFPDGWNLPQVNRGHQLQTACLFALTHYFNTDSDNKKSQPQHNSNNQNMEANQTDKYAISTNSFAFPLRPSHLLSCMRCTTKTLQLQQISNWNGASFIMAGLYKDHSEIEMLQNITGTKIEKRLV